MSGPRAHINKGRSDWETPPFRAASPKRPVLRYHGGKWRLAPWVIRHFPPHRIYVEPYGGAGSVLLRKPPSRAEVYNDLDNEIVNVFRVLRDPRTAEQLRRAVALTPWSRVEFFDSYEHVRGHDPVEEARRTIVRAMMAHAGTSRRMHRTGFRAKAFSQERNAALTWTEWPTEIPVFVERLRTVVIENRPALEVIAQQDGPDTLFYVDPPYPLSTRSGMRYPSELGRAYAHEMTDDDHRELARVLDGIQGMAVVSSYPSDLYERIYAEWTRSPRENVLTDAGARRTEVLWLNAAAARRGGWFDWRAS